MSSKTTDRFLIAVALLVVIVVFLLMSVGMVTMGPMMGSSWGHGMWNGSSVPGWVLLVGVGMRLLALLVVVGVGYLSYRAVTTHASSTDSAIDELRVAYARGDLSDEEYEKRRETLQQEK